MIDFEILKDIRQDRDLYQEEIAKILNISREQYSRYERGVRLIPITKLIILANYYDVSTDYLLNLTNERKRNKIKNKNFSSERLRMLRLMNQLKQEDIAKLLKTTQEQYSKYERGIRIIPIDRLAILSEYYNVSIDYLAGLTDEISTYPKSKH